MKISEYKGEAALDLLDAIIEPATEIIGDAEVSKMLKEKGNILKTARYILRNHGNAVVDIMAALDGVTAEEFLNNCGVLTLPLKVVEILNDRDLLEVFRSAGAQKGEIA